ncbi:hypothetical protein ACFS5L_02395 [Streptomyces phyllanthi]|nr:hypothetical protein [Streptomyces phyllanthi]
MGGITQGVDEDGHLAVFLGESGQQGYLPHNVAVSLGWAPSPTPPTRRRRTVRATRLR